MVIQDRESMEANLKDAGYSSQMAEEFFFLLDKKTENGCWKIIMCMTERR